MDLKNISTEDLIQELKNRKEIKIYDCGPYRNYEVNVKRKYTQDIRGLEQLPSNSTVIVVDED